MRIAVDKADFERFKASYLDPRPMVGDEKLLEYHISYSWLDLVPSDVYIDVAAQDCPFAFFVRDTIGCRVYRQDLYYIEPGIRGEEVGGDASRLPLADNSLSKMSLQNSFEHFEGDNDIGFIIEAQRVLRTGGKLCIVPLFIGEQYQLETEAGWVDERGVKHVWGIGARFSRQYDLTQFKERILDSCSRFAVQVYCVENATEISDDCYVQYFAIFEKT